MLAEYENFKFTFVVDHNNDEWFKANEIASFLHDENYEQAINDFVLINDKKLYSEIPIINHKQTNLENVEIVELQSNSIFINEFGLYALIFNSKKKKFKKWFWDYLIPVLLNSHIDDKNYLLTTTTTTTTSSTTTTMTATTTTTTTMTTTILMNSHI